MPVDIKKLVSTTNNADGRKSITREYSREKYMLVEEAATALDLSIYRTRQLIWDGRLPGVVKGRKFDYIPVESVKAEINRRKSIKEQSADADESRMYRKILNASIVIMAVVNADTTINSTLKPQIIKLLCEYRDQSQSMIEKDSEDK